MKYLPLIILLVCAGISLLAAVINQMFAAHLFAMAAVIVAIIQVHRLKRKNSQLQKEISILEREIRIYTD